MILCNARLRELGMSKICFNLAYYAMLLFHKPYQLFSLIMPQNAPLFPNYAFLIEHDQVIL